MAFVVRADVADLPQVFQAVGAVLVDLELVPAQNKHKLEDARKVVALSGNCHRLFPYDCFD